MHSYAIKVILVLFVHGWASEIYFVLFHLVFVTLNGRGLAIEPHPGAKKAVGRTIVFEFKYCILLNYRFSHGYMSMNTDFSV